MGGYNQKWKWASKSKSNVVVIDARTLKLEVRSHGSTSGSVVPDQHLLLLGESLFTATSHSMWEYSILRTLTTYHPLLQVPVASLSALARCLSPLPPDAEVLVEVQFSALSPWTPGDQYKEAFSEVFTCYLIASRRLRRRALRFFALWSCALLTRDAFHRPHDHPWAQSALPRRRPIVFLVSCTRGSKAARAQPPAPAHNDVTSARALPLVALAS